MWETLFDSFKNDKSEGTGSGSACPSNVRSFEQVVQATNPKPAIPVRLQKHGVSAIRIRLTVLVG